MNGVPSAYFPGTGSQVTLSCPWGTAGGVADVSREPPNTGWPPREPSALRTSKGVNKPCLMLGSLPNISSGYPLPISKWQLKQAAFLYIGPRIVGLKNGLCTVSWKLMGEPLQSNGEA